ncbi:hypothetical protein Peur_054465 [Populus x canadensis]|jgi:hypothetical protein
MPFYILSIDPSVNSTQPHIPLGPNPGRFLANYIVSIYQCSNEQELLNNMTICSSRVANYTILDAVLKIGLGQPKMLETACSMCNPNVLVGCTFVNWC